MNTLISASVENWSQNMVNPFTAGADLPSLLAEFEDFPALHARLLAYPVDFRGDLLQLVAADLDPAQGVDDQPRTGSSRSHVEGVPSAGNRLPLEASIWRNRRKSSGIR
ncbi:hypothetical protein [Saccharopolyspora sp. NPDC002686]|uniref:hypothetical protein n=1 Tax=Saccharopolyspora sp. NPDC002686 TaxID=3154541 RepID=UPI00331C3055